MAGAAKQRTTFSLLTSLKLAEIPKQVGAGGEAQGADDDHPYPGDDVDAALGDFSDPSFLPPAPAQQGVGAEGDARDAREREQDTGGQRMGDRGP